MERWLAGIPGADILFDWFGYWPTFHDGEVISLSLNRETDSTLRVHTWEMTSQIDERGVYVLRKHVVVRITFAEITSLQLDGFNGQNVLSDLTFRQNAKGYEVELGHCYGLAGSIGAKSLSIQLESFPCHSRPAR